MKISKDDLLRINQGFGGNLRSGSSIDYAIDMQENKKLGEYKKLAYLLRAILFDHLFSDGNKRTSMFIALVFAEEKKKRIDRELLLHHIVSMSEFHLRNSEHAQKPLVFDIAKQNIIDIRNIEWRLKNAIR